MTARNDQKRSPSDADLARLLGPATAHWDRLVADARALCPKAVAAWKCYAGKYGWTFVIRDAKRNLVYLKPADKEFTASFALNDAAVKAEEKAHLPAAVLRQIRESPRYPEGRAVRLTVATPRAAVTAMKLLAIKAGS